VPLCGDVAIYWDVCAAEVFGGLEAQYRRDFAGVRTKEVLVGDTWGPVSSIWPIHGS